MKVLRVIILTVLTVGFTHLHAQEYDLAMGLRAGSANGISVKKFMGYSTAVEGMLLYRQGGLRATALLEAHWELSDGFSLFLGGGGHAGFTTSAPFEGQQYRRPAAGVDVIAGGEFAFPRSPFVIAFDLKPTVELLQGTRISGNNAGVTLRYMLD